MSNGKFLVGGCCVLPKSKVVHFICLGVLCDLCGQTFLSLRVLRGSAWSPFGCAIERASRLGGSLALPERVFASPTLAVA